MKEIRIFANRLKADKRTDNKYLRYKNTIQFDIKRHSVVEMSNTINKLW